MSTKTIIIGITVIVILVVIGVLVWYFFFRKKCSTNEDCIKGMCNVEEGECKCDAGWTGSTCNEIDPNVPPTNKPTSEEEEEENEENSNENVPDEITDVIDISAMKDCQSPCFPATGRVELQGGDEWAEDGECLVGASDTGPWYRCGDPEGPMNGILPSSTKACNQPCFRAGQGGTPLEGNLYALEGACIVGTNESESGPWYACP